MTKPSFRDILFDRLEREDLSMKDLERMSKVPYDRIYNMKKRPDGTTSVETAIQLAAGFRETLDEFMGNHRKAEEQEILRLISQLSAEDIQQIVAFGKGLAAAKGQVPPKSGEGDQ